MGTVSDELEVFDGQDADSEHGVEDIGATGEGLELVEGALALKPGTADGTITREQRRSRRKREIRARTISVKRMTCSSVSVRRAISTLQAACDLGAAIFM